MPFASVAKATTATSLAALLALAGLHYGSTKVHVDEQDNDRQDLPLVEERVLILLSILKRRFQS